MQFQTATLPARHQPAIARFCRREDETLQEFAPNLRELGEEDWQWFRNEFRTEGIAVSD